MFKNFLCILLFANVVFSYKKYDPVTEGKISRVACNVAIRKSATFCAVKTAKTCMCSNPYFISSMAGCINFGKAPSGSEKEYLQFCKSYYNVTLTEETYLAGYQNFSKNAVYTSEIENFNASRTIEVPIKVNATVICIYRKAYGKFYGNYRDSLYYGSGMVAYWALVLSVFSISHWAKFFCPGLVKKLTGPFSNFLRKHVILPAVGTKCKAKDVSWFNNVNFLAPTRIETIILVGFCAVTIFCNSHNISYFKDDPVFKSKALAVNRYLGDRSGITATIMVPVVILFSGRNNFLQWVTGINFATFITYHKWIARVMFTLVVVHAGAYSANFVIDGSFAANYKEVYLQHGTYATVAGGIIWFQSVLYFRREWYEMFLLVHIVMAVLFVVGTWYHVIDLGYLEFLYASIACWAFDRAVRIARLIHFGFPKATVTLLANDTLKIIVRKPKFWHATPGGHAFIHFLRPSCFWQSHPFTFTVSPDSDEYIVMYVKVKGGITHGLYQYLQTFPEKSAQIRVTLEGPYGEPTPAKVYDSAVFIAGGSGIPGIYSEAIDLAHKRSLQKSNKVTKLHWIIKEYTSLLWFHDEIKALENSGLQCTIYVTQPTLSFNCEQYDTYDNELYEKGSSSNENDVDKMEPTEFSDKQEFNSAIIRRLQKGLPHVNFKEGRPIIMDLVKREMEESAGSVAYVTCGHPVMVDEVRYSCAHSLQESKGKRVDFFEQLQVWT